MQKNFIYLLKNRVQLEANITGYISEYRSVYKKQVEITRGIDNTIEFEVRNQDQKPLSLVEYTPKFVAFDENKKMILEKDGTVLDDVVTKTLSADTGENTTTITLTSTSGIVVGQTVTGNNIKDKTLVSQVDNNTVTLNKATNGIVTSNTILTFQSYFKKGMFSIVVSENDLLNVKSQYLSYAIYLVKSDNSKTLAYTNTDFKTSGVIYVDDNTFPGPSTTYSVNSFTNLLTEAVDAQPGINGNEALHTAAFYTDAYIGNIVVQASLDNQITSDSNWADVATVTFDGTETEPKPVNFTGVFSYIRFKASEDPTGKVSKILIRN